MIEKTNECLGDISESNWTEVVNLSVDTYMNNKAQTRKCYVLFKLVRHVTNSWIPCLELMREKVNDHLTWKKWSLLYKMLLVITCIWECVAFRSIGIFETFFIKIPYFLYLHCFGKIIVVISQITTIKIQKSELFFFFFNF